MKKIICFLFATYLCHIVSAQSTLPEFHVPMYFEDGVGNKDTVSAGFDINAEGDILDGDFGEKIIDNKPWKSDFEVRLGTFAGPFGKLPRMSKIDIQENECLDSVTGYSRTFHVLYIKVKHFPIKWSWDSTKFKNNCTINSFYDRSAESQLAAYPALFGRQLFRKFKGFSLLTESYIKNIDKHTFKYDFIDPISGVDSIKSICFYFLDKKRIAYNYAATNDYYQEQVKVYPNPTNDILLLGLKENIDLPNNTQLQILSTNGQLLQQQAVSENTIPLEIDVSALHSGLYFVQLRSPQELLYTGKFVKIE